MRKSSKNIIEILGIEKLCSILDKGTGWKEEVEGKRGSVLFTGSIGPVSAFA